MRFNVIALVSTFLVLATIPAIQSAVDQSLEENANGKNVVEVVVEKINALNLPDDYGFLRRIAYVETRDGNETQPFPRPNYGGIWSVAEVQFNRTKDMSLLEIHGRIRTAFNINWIQTSWQDLLKPLYSGIAARLFLHSFNAEIPQGLEDQAKFWDQRYNRHDLWTNLTFVNRTDEFEELNPPCSGKMDLVIILDGSGSVGDGNFELCKRFVTDLIGSYSLRNVRLGFVLYSSEADIIFELDNYLDMDQLKEIVRNIPYPNARTETNLALQRAYEIFTKAEPRPGVPRVMTIFTDGQSSNGVDNIELLRQLNVSSYAVGITQEINPVELEQLAYGNAGNVFTLDTFDVLTDFYRRLNDETCKVPQRPSLNEPVEDALNKGEKRYYSFSVPAEGMTIALESMEGRISGYYSLSEENPNPSSAFHDGVLAAEGTFFGAGARILADELNVWLSVEGFEDTNVYEIEALEGYQVVIPPTTEEVTTDEAEETSSSLPTTEEHEGESTSEGGSTDEDSSTAESSEATTTTKAPPADAAALSAMVTIGLLTGAIIGLKVLNL